MPKQKLVARRQTDALKLEALRAYFDFREGRPTAETVAEKLDIPVRTVRKWWIMTQTKLKLILWTFCGHLSAIIGKNGLERVRHKSSITLLPTFAESSLLAPIRAP